MLAAGVGSRLTGAHTSATGDDDHPPKCLLAFAGCSLLARHLDILRAAGIEGLTLVTGYRADDIHAEIANAGAADFVTTVQNPDYRDGSGVSLLAASAALTSHTEADDGVLLMDADVLYHRAMVDRLIATSHPSCMLLDRDFVPGDEPVKICVRDGRIVEFRKAIGETQYDLIGESIGFFRLARGTATAIAAAARAYVDAGAPATAYEEAIRDVLLARPDAFGIEDVTGVPWIEIDFPEDIGRAEDEIIPAIAAFNPS